MESFGAELKETPYPLVAALGARDLQAKVLQLVRTINEEFVPKLHVTSLPIEHRFPVKKEVREKHGTFPNQTQRDFDGYRVQGILKTKWLKKHHESVPAVVLLFHEFDPRWNQRDWTAQESTIKEEMDQIKKGISGRECRVLLILVQQVDDVGVAPVNVTDERLASLRRRLETDSKTLVLLRSRDLVRGSSVLAKLESSIRNYALEYYKAQAKRVKRYKKALTKSSLLPLQVRYSFKIAHYYEFRRYTTKVLQHYEAAYRAVTQLPLTHDAVEKIEGGQSIGYSQVKTMAEYINFKLCYHLIFSSSNIKAAVEQLHRHMKVYGRALGPVERVFEHWEWVSRQYHVFAQLLAEAVSIRGSLSSTGLDSDVYKEPYLYYSIAAKYATYRRKAAANLGLSDPDAVAVVSLPGQVEIQLAIPHSDFKIVPSTFVGGDPVVSEASLGEPSYGAFVKYRYSIERLVPHAKKAIHLIEQAIHHLGLYIADQKVPRTRLKSRFLVALGVERLACNEFDRARVELQKAKLAFGGEQWWAETAQVLRLLLVCTFRQADTAAYIDTCLQLLSPALEEFVPLMERIQVQDGFEAAWKDPARLGLPFSAESSLASYEMRLDDSRMLIKVLAQFDRVYACVREEVVLCARFDSRFPSVITMPKIELLFSDERYNMVVYHRDSADGDAVYQADGQWFGNLTFDPTAVKQFRITTRVLDGKSILRYQETRFHFGSGQGRVNLVDGTMGDEQFLTFVLPHDVGVTSSNADQLHTNTKSLLADGRVPVMGKGPGSPSFVRRKSMFSVAELGRSHEVDTGDVVEEDGTAAVLRSSALAILQPRPKAALEIVTKHALLSGDFRVLSFLVKSKDDMLRNPTFRVTSDPPPSPTDALFYAEDESNPGRLVPVPLDATAQPRDRTRIRDLHPQSEEKFSVIIRSSKAATLRLTVNVTYLTKSGVQVSLEERFELQCRDPFALSSGFVHDFPNGVGVATSEANAKQSYAIVGKTVNLQGAVQCEALEPLRIVSMAFEPAAVEGIVASGFAEWADVEADECQVLRAGDTRSFCLRLLPKQASTAVALGRVKLAWRRLSSVVPTSSLQRNNLVTTWLDIPPVTFVETPLTISLRPPAFGVEGTLLSLEIHVRNNESVFHSVRIKPFDESGDFMIAGRTNAVEDLLPQDEHVFSIGLIPTTSGYLRLPQLEITSVTYNLAFANSNERHELFVFPKESAQWKQSAAATDKQDAGASELLVGL